MTIKRLRLVQLNESDVGTLHYLVRSVTSIGRASSSDIVINRKQVSRKHVVIRMQNGGELVTVEDCGSANGAYVNGERILEPVELTDGMTLTVGDVDFGVEATTAEEEQKALESSQLESHGTIDVDEYASESVVIAHRNAELAALGLDKFEPVDALDEIAQIAATIFGSQIGFVSVVSQDHCYYKGAYELSQRQWLRAETPCALVVEAHALIWVGDMFVDTQLLSRPFLSQDPTFRFYAAAPFRGPSGIVIGTVGVASPQERSAGAAQLEALTNLAKCVERQVSLQLEKKRAHELHLRLVQSKSRQSDEETH